MTRTKSRIAALALISFAAFAAGRARAQEIEPRSYVPTPVRTHFILSGYVHSDGAILFDTASPVTDIDTKIDSMLLGYGTVRSVFGHASSFAIVAPYVWGDVSGNVGETGRREVTRVGVGDVRLRFGMQFIGGEPLTPAEFIKRPPSRSLGMSLTVVAPTGEYMPDKLVNIGANRWAFKPEIGYSQPFGRWLAEASVGVWLFEDNDNFFGGGVKQQDPLGTAQINLSYTFKPRLWAAVGATYYEGGRTSLDGVDADNRQSNSRIGATLSIPLSLHQSLRVAWSTGTTVRFGGDFDTYGVFWSYAWAAKREP